MTYEPPPRAHVYREYAESEVPPERSDHLGLLRYLRDRFESPLRILDPDHGLQVELDARWLKWCRTEGTSPKLHRFNEKQSLEHYLEDRYVTKGRLNGLHTDAEKVHKWYARVSASFRSNVGNFMAKVYEPEEWSKHQPRGWHDTANDLQAASGGKASVLGFGLTPGVIGMLARSAESQFFDELFGDARFRCALNCMCLVGFSRKSATSYLALEWTPQGIHGYPINREDFKRFDGRRQGADDVLQGFFRRTREVEDESPDLDDLAADEVIARNDAGDVVLTAGQLRRGDLEARVAEQQRRTWPYDGQVSI